MDQGRREFVKGTLSTAVLAGAGGLIDAPQAEAKPRPTAGAGEMPRDMTFLTIARDGEYGLGIKTERGVLDVKKAARLFGMTAPLTTDEVIREGDQGLTVLVKKALAGKSSAIFLDEDHIKFGPAVLNPQKIIMLLTNYRRLAIEAKLPIPAVPTFFNKFNNTINCHNGEIKLPTAAAKKFDHEVELVVVMGRKAWQVSEADALSYVFGYCVGNDFTARDLVKRTSQVMLGKTCDGFGPIGPYLVTADQISDPQNLKLECRINGEVHQASNTDDMIYTCAQIISYASGIFTLLPGDIFFTGTPHGVINTKPEAEQVWLKAGDEVESTIENLGTQRFTLV